MLKLSPVYPNKLSFMVLAKDPSLTPNWFLCSSPCDNPNGDEVLDIDPHTLFFDESTGFSYRIKRDNIEEHPCYLLDGSSLKNIENHEWIRSFTGNKDDMRCLVDVGCCGIAFKFCKKTFEDHIICTRIELHFNKKVIQRVKMCPYMNYVMSREQYFGDKLDIPRIFEEKPGPISLEIRDKLVKNA